MNQTRLKHCNDERRVQVEYIPHFEFVNWSPKARIAAVAGGVAAIIAGQRIKGIGRQLANFAGISLGLRALLNKDLTQVVGTLLSPTIRLNREIIVDAPTEVVISFWSKIENYPRFMSFVRRVETSRHGNLLWEIAGPGGVPVHWEASILSWPPSETVAWRTVPGSPLFNSGRVSIQSLDLERSKVRVELAYALRAGGLGYAVACILGFDPRGHFEGDLTKMKSLVEDEWKSKRATDWPLSS